MTELGDALQRIHQLETALVTIQTWPIDQARLRREGWVGVVDVARAALGDTPAPPRGYDLTDDEAAEVLRASFGEPPQPEMPKESVFDVARRIAGSDRPETEGT